MSKTTRQWEEPEDADELSSSSSPPPQLCCCCCCCSAIDGDAVLALAPPSSAADRAFNRSRWASGDRLGLGDGVGDWARLLLVGAACDGSLVGGRDGIADGMVV